MCSRVGVGGGGMGDRGRQVVLKRRGGYQGRTCDAPQLC